MAKRTKQFNLDISAKSTVHYWPIIWCTSEDRCIIIGTVPLIPIIHGKQVIFPPADKTQFVGAKYLEDKYQIDFSKCVVGKPVLCPVCGGPVYFRVFPSTTLPDFITK